MNDSFLPGKSNGGGQSSRHRTGRNRAATIAFVLMTAAVLLAALGVSDSISQRWGDIAKIAAVAMFVSAMVLLALGMIGDIYRRDS